VVHWFQHLTEDAQVTIMCVLACGFITLRIVDILIRSKEGK
jgi:hypothetical protein